MRFLLVCIVLLMSCSKPVAESATPALDSEVAEAVSLSSDVSDVDAAADATLAAEVSASLAEDATVD